MGIETQQLDYSATGITIQRSIRERLLGALMYAVAGPLVAGVAAVSLGILITYTVPALGFSPLRVEQTSELGAIAIAAVVLIAAACSYVQRAFSRIILYPDRIEIIRLMWQRSVRYEECRHLRVRFAGNRYWYCVEFHRFGRLWIPISGDEVLPAIGRWLMPVLVERMSQQVQAGERISVAHRFRRPIIVTRDAITNGQTSVPWPLIDNVYRTEQAYWVHTSDGAEIQISFHTRDAIVLFKLLNQRAEKTGIPHVIGSTRISQAAAKRDV